MLGGWGDEFDDDEPVNEEEKKAENIEQSKKEIEEIMPPNVLNCWIEKKHVW